MTIFTFIVLFLMFMLIDINSYLLHCICYVYVEHADSGNRCMGSAVNLALTETEHGWIV